MPFPTRTVVAGGLAAVLAVATVVTVMQPDDGARRSLALRDFVHRNMKHSLTEPLSELSPEQRTAAFEHERAAALKRRRATRAARHNKMVSTASAAPKKAPTKHMHPPHPSPHPSPQH